MNSSIILQNMVGPGDVDNDLEPEVKDECNTKYGDVVKVLIHEVKRDAIIITNTTHRLL